MSNKNYRFYGFGLLGILSGFSAFLFFAAALFAIERTHKQEYKFFSTDLNKKTEDISKRIEDLVVDVDSSNESDRSTRLISLNAKFNSAIFDIRHRLNDYNNQFIIVSLLGGSCLTIIALMNFHQYGKIASSNSERIDKKQFWKWAQESCNIIDDPFKKQECIKGIFELGDEHYNGTNSKCSSETSTDNGTTTFQEQQKKI